MEQRAPLHVFRAGLVTATVFSLAGGAHLLGGGTLPHPVLVMVLAVLVLAPMTGLAGRRLSLAHLLGILGIAQVGLHEAFTLFSTPLQCSTSTHGGNHTDAVAVVSCRTGAIVTAAHHEFSGAGLAMLGGHVLAVVLTALVLHGAEAGLWLAWDWLLPLTTLSRPAPVPLDDLRPCPPPLRESGQVWRGLRRDRVRGPPITPVSQSTSWT